MQKKRGISLIVLVITIIVMVILAGTIILTLNNSGIINKSSEAVFKQNVKSYQSELSLYLANKLAEDSKYDYKTLNATSATTPNIKDVIPSMQDTDVAKFEVASGELKYVGTNREEATWSEELGLETNEIPLTEAEYNALYEEEIALALQYGTVTDGVYNLKEEYAIWNNGNHILEKVSLAIPYGVTEIAGEAFGDQYNVERVILPETLTTIGNMSFASTTFSQIVLPKSLTTIGSCAFLASFLTQIVIPENVTKIDSNAFESHVLKNIYIESEECTIASNIFARTESTEYTIYVRNESIKSAIELALNNAYEDEHNVTIICNEEWVAPE